MEKVRVRCLTNSGILQNLIKLALHTHTHKHGLHTKLSPSLCEGHRFLKIQTTDTNL